MHRPSNVLSIAVWVVVLPDWVRLRLAAWGWFKTEELFDDLGIEHECARLQAVAPM